MVQNTSHTPKTVVDLLSYNFATLNINNISNQTKVDAFKTFVRVNEIDIIFIQEVENDRLEIPGFELFFNIDLPS